MEYKKSEVLQFVAENDVKFIRLAFCDIFGIQKNISIMPEKLEEAFEKGIPFDGGSVFTSGGANVSDLVLCPDPSTLSVLPWRPSHGRVVRLYCDIRYPDGRAFEGDCRKILENAEERAKSMGYTCKVGTECEFYLFKLDENGEPTEEPYDHGGYMDVAPADKGENIRREICLTLEEMGIAPETSHHEKGPGQNEIDFKCDSVCKSADNFITFKNVVKTVAARNGLHASFMPKPIEKQYGSGLHFNLSLYKNNRENIFEGSDALTAEAQGFVAGIMARIGEISAVLNPVTESYRRLGDGKAPAKISWSRQNRLKLVRVSSLGKIGSHMELRSADSVCNPYLALALILHAGLDGIEQKMSAAREEEELGALPSTLADAVDAFENSEFAAKYIPKKLLAEYIACKRDEIEYVKRI